MNTLIASVEDLNLNLDKFKLETSAMEAVVSNRMGPTARKPLDKVMIHMGLESASSLCATISQEGVFSWIKTKLSALGRKIAVVINKIYAKLTRADEATKALIAKASTDASVELPISGKKAAAVLTATAALIGGISYLTVAMFSEPDKEKIKKNIEKYKADIFACKVLRAYTDENKNDRVTKFYRNRVASVVHKRRKQLKNAEAKLNQEQTKGFLSKFSGGLSTIRKVLSKFASKFKSSESAVGSAAKASEGDAAKKKGLWERLSGSMACIKDVFMLAVNWFSSLPNMFKRKSKEA